VPAQFVIVVWSLQRTFIPRTAARCRVSHDRWPRLVIAYSHSRIRAIRPCLIRP